MVPMKYSEEEYIGLIRDKSVLTVFLVRRAAAKRHVQRHLKLRKFAD